MQLHLFLETLMTVNEISPSCVSIVADNAKTDSSRPELRKSREITALLDSSAHKEKIRWSATGALLSRRGTMIERSVSDSVLSRPTRASSPERRETRNACWDNTISYMEPASTKTSDQRYRASKAQTPSLDSVAERTPDNLLYVSEACNNGALISSPPERTMMHSMQRTKSLDSKLHKKNIVDVRMSRNKNFQKTKMLTIATQSRIKPSDTLRQALGMMAPSTSTTKKKKSNLPSHVKPNSPPSQGPAGGLRKKAVRNALGSMTNVSGMKKSTLCNNGIGGLRMPQRTEMPRENTDESRIQSDSLRQLLGMMPSSVAKQNFNLKVHVKPSQKV
jgi:hypothetical protein